MDLTWRAQLFLDSVEARWERRRPRHRKDLLATVLGWSLLVTPVVLLVGGRAGICGLLSFSCGFLALVLVAGDFTDWDYGTDDVFRELLTVVPMVTSAVLLVAGPWLVPWAVHDTVGQPVRARIVERSGTGGPGEIRYRLVGAGTEESLGRLLYGLPERAPVGAVVEVSVVPGGWTPPVSAERLADGEAAPYVTALGAMTAVHLLACAAAWVGWPRRPR